MVAGDHAAASRGTGHPLLSSVPLRAEATAPLAVAELTGRRVLRALRGVARDHAERVVAPGENPPPADQETGQYQSGVVPKALQEECHAIALLVVAQANVGDPKGGRQRCHQAHIADRRIQDGEAVRLAPAEILQDGLNGARERLDMALGDAHGHEHLGPTSLEVPDSPIGSRYRIDRKVVRIFEIVGEGGH